MGGTKRKIAIAKRETKSQRAVAFSKRRKGLFKKAADLCVMSGAQVAVLTTTPSEKLNTVYSFGHSSVDDVVNHFLGGRRPPQKSGSGFWWESQGLENCDNAEELRFLIDKLQSLKNDVEIRLQNMEKTQEISEASGGNVFCLEIDNCLSFPDSSATEPGEEISDVLGTWCNENNITIDIDQWNEKSDSCNGKDGGFLSFSEPEVLMSELEAFLMA